MNVLVSTPGYAELAINNADSPEHAIHIYRDSIFGDREPEAGTTKYRVECHYSVTVNIITSVRGL